MKIGPHTTARISYRLTLAGDGKLIEAVSREKPDSLIFGINQLLPAFEEKLTGLAGGEAFDFVLSADEAYGPVDPYAIFDIPIDTFYVDGKADEKMLQEGTLIPMTDNDGNKHLGRITKVFDQHVTMDFNHHLPGKDLRFTGTILEVIQHKTI